jgi:hypothetical protein
MAGDASSIGDDWETEFKNRDSASGPADCARVWGKAGITQPVHPHLFRHQMLTYLTAKGLSDAQIQLISGHESKKSLDGAGKGHFERLVEARIERPFGFWFRGHAASPLSCDDRRPIAGLGEFAQHPMHELYADRSLAHRRSNTFDASGTHVTGSEDSRHAAL